VGAELPSRCGICKGFPRAFRRFPRQAAFERKHAKEKRREVALAPPNM